ncbi:MAG: Eco57I restriction-modification methylase domain-containing protein [Raoultibacter sp.]
MESLLQRADTTRLNTIASTNTEVRQKYAQFLTPPQTAQLAVNMFSDSDTPLKCLDLGAGTGMLSSALYARYGNRITRLDAFEKDSLLAQICARELTQISVQHKVYNCDVLIEQPKDKYHRIILNPPYKKMAADDWRAALLPARTPNMYSAFVMLAIQQLEPFGECVAIIPRSWMNGQYFATFRKWILENASIDTMHVYGSRSEIFSDTDVLQETMLVRFSKRKQVTKITISTSDTKQEQPVQESFLANSLIDNEDDLKIIRIAPDNNLAHLPRRLGTSGFCPSTGKIVDFRSRKILRKEASDGCVPLLYPCNFSQGVCLHPVKSDKAQWLFTDCDKTKKLLTQPGDYVVVKRFSAKEETRRVKAFPLHVDKPLALENHLNFIHGGTPRTVTPLEPEIVKGLCLWLNSTVIDDWFRGLSGSTQVNACDIKRMPVPSNQQLVALSAKWKPSLTQGEIDELCGR